MLLIYIVFNRHPIAGRESMNHSTLMKTLTYLGATPFFLALYVQLSGQSFLGVTGTQWFLSYGLVILSFMAGTLWGQVVNHSLQAKPIAVLSNIITLAAWFAFLLAGAAQAVVVIALGFSALYAVERSVLAAITRPDYYLALRLRVTALVLLAHGLMLWHV